VEPPKQPLAMTAKATGGITQNRGMLNRTAREDERFPAEPAAGASGCELGRLDVKAFAGNCYETERSPRLESAGR
jgi:hypothetical protein